MSAQQTYLGDGLYAEFDGFGFKLWADRGNDTHWVYLEPEVFDALVRFRASFAKPQLCQHCQEIECDPDCVGAT